MARKTARPSAELARRVTISGLDQPWSLPRARANTSMKSEPENVTSPGQSMRPSRPRMLGRRVTVMYMASRPMGRLRKKMASHPSPSVSTPPTSGPIATAPPSVAPHTPNAVPRSRPWKSCASRASEVANIIAPPAPWTPRARLRNRGLVARPHRAEEAVNTINPVRKTRWRPSRSASDPAVRSRAASVSA